jgi:hypothetical protein
MSNLLYNFYTTERMSGMMSDQGGPFGFDIHYALEIDYLLTKYKCDAIIETGTNLGDTTEYLAKQYPSLKIITCEINEGYYLEAKQRLSKYDNIECLLGSSNDFVEKTKNDFSMPLYYLDAHWEEYWPLKDELNSILKGVVCVSDCMTHDERYGYDRYNGVICNKNMVVNNSTPVYYNNSFNPNEYEYPCMQMVRRSGRMYYCVDEKSDYFKDSKYFVSIDETN